MLYIVDINTNMKVVAATFVLLRHRLISTLMATRRKQTSATMSASSVMISVSSAMSSIAVVVIMVVSLEP